MIAFAAPASADATSTISVGLHVRYYDELAFEGIVTLHSGATTTIADSLGGIHDLSSASALVALDDGDIASDAFRVSDLAYYASFDSLLVNCIELAAASTTACYNWQYTVNDATPFVGADKYVLTDGDDVYFYFGQQHRVSLATSTALTNEPVFATAEQYRYRTNIWEPLSGVTVGASQPDPANPWSPLVFATSTTDSGGLASFSLSFAGAYQVGIAEDYYYPTVPLTITAPPEPEEPETPPPAAAVGGSPSHARIDAERAHRFIRAHQGESGAVLNSPMYSDWTALAYASFAGAEDGRTALKQYLLTDPSPGNLLTDYERRAMALLALGINPYTGVNTNYIQKILDRFDGAQFGEPDLWNDDIFALFPLIKSGYSSSDPVIASTTRFILDKQEATGAWIGPDITAAAIQALSLVPSHDGVGSAIIRAKSYLSEMQDPTGGFGANPDSTSWVLSAIASVGESEQSWLKQGNSPQDYLYDLQGEDGGIGDLAMPESSRVWSTAYAIPASLGKSWNDILSSVPKQAPAVSLPPIPGGVGGTDQIPAVWPTSTLFATSTPIAATSTAFATTTLVSIATSTAPVPLSEAPIETAPSSTPVSAVPAPKRTVRRGLAAGVAGVKIVEKDPTDAPAPASGAVSESAPAPEKDSPKKSWKFVFDAALQRLRDWLSFAFGG